MLNAFEFAMARVRPDSTIIRIENEGLVGLLYDQASEDELRDEAPEVLFGVGDSTLDDEPTMAALRSGRLLVYGMESDGSVAMEVIVGPPLRADQMPRGHWAESRPGHIDVPSGRLCIHSYNSLPLGDPGPEPGVHGGFIDVSPGRYHVRLYRKDGVPPELDNWDDLEPGDYDRLDAERIDDVLVLTPFAAGEPVPATHNVLFGECVGCGDPEAGTDGIVDGAWSGHVEHVLADGYVIGLTEDHARVMDLKPGDCVLLGTGEVQFQAIFWGPAHVRSSWHHVLGPAGRAGLADHVVAEAEMGRGWMAWRQTSGSWLEVRPLGAEGGLPAWPVGTAITLRQAPARCLPAVPAARIHQGTAHVEVLASSGHGLFLSLDDKAFRRLQVGSKDAVEIDAGGHRFVVRPYERPNYARFAEPPSRDNVTIGPPVCDLVRCEAVSERPLLAVHLDPHVRFLTDEERAERALPVLPVGTPATVRRHVVQAEGAA